jgi:hypothetical protein
MTGEPDIIELSTAQKTQLLALGLEAESDYQQDRECRADSLYDVLTHPLPLGSAAVNSLPAPLRGLSRNVRSIAGDPLIELLTTPDTNISAIEAIKEYAKNSGQSAKSEDRTEIFLSVYYAAIASGLTFHGRKISQHPFKHLADAFGKLAEEPWIHAKLRDLMSRARELCDSKLRQAGNSDQL